METKSGAAAAASDREIVISRVIDAPRDLVWKAWTDAKHLGQWWGPNGFTTTTSKMDFKPGGVWRFVMHGPDGRDYQNRITYLEIVAPERLVQKLDGGEDADPATFHTTVTFAEQNGKTTVTMTAVFPSATERDRVVKEVGAIEGGQQTLGRLAKYVETMSS